MNKKNSIYLIVMSLVIMISSIIVVSFAYIGRPTSTGNTNINVIINNATSNGITFSYTGGTELGLNVTTDDLLLTTVGSSASNTIRVHFHVSLNGTYNNSVTCTYKIFYVPTTTFNKSTSLSTPELSLKGLVGNIEQFNVSLDNVSSTLLLATKDITVNGQSGVNMVNSNTWDFTMEFHNLNADQSSALGQSPKGKIMFQPQSCKNS